MASRAFSTGWLGSQASQSGQRPGEMVGKTMSRESRQSQCGAFARPTASQAVESPPHPLPHSSRPLTARSLLTPYSMAHRLGCPSPSRGAAALPGTNNEAFLPWLTQPGTGPASRPPACPGHGADPGRTPPHPSCLIPAAPGVHRRGQRPHPAYASDPSPKRSPHSCPQVLELQALPTSALGHKTPSPSSLTTWGN